MSLVPMEPLHFLESGKIYTRRTLEIWYAFLIFQMRVGGIDNGHIARIELILTNTVINE
jgi:hypothetical protein